MRVIECDVCGQALSAANDEELVEIARRHMEERHSGEGYDDAARVASTHTRRRTADALPGPAGLGAVRPKAARPQS